MELLFHQIGNYQRMLSVKNDGLNLIFWKDSRFHLMAKLYLSLKTDLSVLSR